MDKWRTIGGRRILIKEGQSLEDAMRASGKFKSLKPKGSNRGAPKTVYLPKDEYAHVMSEIATNLTKEQAQKKVFNKAIGDYIYAIENNGFGEFRIVGKRRIENIDEGQWWL